MATDANGNTEYKLKLTGVGLTVEKDLDGPTAMRILGIVMGGDVDAGAPAEPSAKERPTRRRKRAPAKAVDDGEGRSTRRRSGPAIVKDLSMRPSGKTAFAAFAAEKGPSSHVEKQTVIVYWLKHDAGLESGITADHVNTCYVEAKWARPRELDVSLRLTASRKGWIDTADSKDIRITTRGEDFVQHELPKKSKTKK